jgi:hypothetical protein
LVARLAYGNQIVTVGLVSARVRLVWSLIESIDWERCALADTSSVIRGKDHPSRIRNCYINGFLSDRLADIVSTLRPPRKHRRHLGVAVEQGSKYPRVVYASVVSDFSFATIVSRPDDLVVNGCVRVRSVTP